MKIKLLLVLLFILGTFFRLYRLSSYPPLLWDEAALGYNSYSILKTGRDEFGQVLPLIFKSFGDYKPGLYIYLTLPFVKLLGLSVLSVRLPGVIFGSIPICGRRISGSSNFGPYTDMNKIGIFCI
jgi:4-amino-4-deoxy-L-arabinose transferase-like glycosyltransferase